MIEQESRYQALRAQLLAIERISDSYLTDECVDAENCTEHVYGTPEYWTAMCISLRSAVQDRAEEQGVDLTAAGFIV